MMYPCRGVSLFSLLPRAPAFGVKPNGRYVHFLLPRAMVNPPVGVRALTSPDTTGLAFLDSIMTSADAD